MFFLKSAVFLRKKSPRQGCTKPKTELGMHQNPHFHRNPLKINKNPKINPPSTITIPESVQSALRFIDMLILRPEDKGGLMPHLAELVRLFDFLNSLDTSGGGGRQPFFSDSGIVMVDGELIFGFSLIFNSFS